MVDLLKFINCFFFVPRNPLPENHLQLQVMSDGIVDAIATWFDLHLDSHTSISTAPSWDLSWEQAVFPVQVRNTLLLLPYGSLLELMAEISLQGKYWFDVITQPW